MPFASIDRPRVAALVLGAGSGSRLGSVQNKVFLPLAGRPVLAWSFRHLSQVASIDRFTAVVRDVDRQATRDLIDHEVVNVADTEADTEVDIEADTEADTEADIEVDIVVGGATRHDSEVRALRSLAPAIEAGEINLVLIHDGARPLISPDFVRTLIAVAAEYGTALPGVVSTNIRPVQSDGTLDLTHGGSMVRAQTPQVFHAGTLLEAYERSTVDGFLGTDTASCIQQYSELPLRHVPGDPRNLKIMYPEDLRAAEALLADGLLGALPMRR